jgi:hypothetical protein
MKKITKHKLSLDTTVIRQLDGDQLHHVAGASGMVCIPTINPTTTVTTSTANCTSFTR